MVSYTDQVGLYQYRIISLPSPTNSLAHSTIVGKLDPANSNSRYFELSGRYFKLKTRLLNRAVIY